MGTPRWGISCSVPGDEISVNLQIPVRTAGPIHETLPSGNPTFNLSVDVFNLAQGSVLGSMTEASDNLSDAALDGSIGASNQANGKVTASWSTPGSGCNSGEPGSPCVPGSVTMTFNVTLPE